VAKRKVNPCDDLQCGRCEPCLQNERTARQIEVAKLREMPVEKLRESTETMLTRIADEHRRRWNER
jgi:hypothetical protein